MPLLCGLAHNTIGKVPLHAVIALLLHQTMNVGFKARTLEIEFA
jgi:hypothetical protein